MKTSTSIHCPGGVVLKDIALSAEVLGSLLKPVKSDALLPTARYRCDVSSELCCPSAKSRRWIPLLITRCAVVARVFVQQFLELLCFYFWSFFRHVA